MKINSSKIWLFALLAVAGLCGCDEDSAFAGEDNFVTSFQLKQGDYTLNAAVSEGNIVLVAPENLPLDGATVNVVISENARIEPNPATVTDWDSGQTFTVTSYSGSKNVYTYTVQRQVVSKEGDIVLLTQADVDALAALKLTQISGSLIVGAAAGKDSVYSLAPLSGLKTIQHGLYIHATYAGTDLAGLEKLEKVGKLQFLRDTKLRTVEFPKLTSVMSDLTLNQSKIKTIRFPELLNVDKTLSVSNCDTLTMMEFPKLKNIVENLTLTGGYSTNMLQTIDFPALENIGGAISLSNWKAATSLNLPLLTTTKAISIISIDKLARINMPAVKSTLGSVTISYNNLLNQLDLSSMQAISGDLRLEGNAALETLDGIRSLATVNGELFLSNMNKLKNVDGLKSLRTVGKRLYISSLTGMEDASLSGLSGLSTVGTELIISQVPIKRFTGFALSKLTSMGIYATSTVEEIDVRNLDITNTLTLSNLSSPFVLKGKETCNYALSISECAPTIDGFSQVKTLSYDISSRLQDQVSLSIKKITGDATVSVYGIEGFGMPGLEEVGGKFTFSTYSGIQAAEFPKLKKTGAATLKVASLPRFALPALQTVDGDCTISTGEYNADKLADLQMPALTTVNGVLSLAGYSSYYTNSKLTHLNGFSALTNVQGITVSYNKGLMDFSGVKNALPSFAASAWKVTNNGYNPSYQEMLDGKYVKPYSGM